MITFQPLVFDEQAILDLYNSNHWTNYTMDKHSLFSGIKQSLYTYAAYDNDTLIGLIRVVGDNHTILYIQDILVHPNYHRKGIGKTLMNHILHKYKHIRQIVLTTDDSAPQHAFYIDLGFAAFDGYDLRGYYHKK